MAVPAGASREAQASCGARSEPHPGTAAAAGARATLGPLAGAGPGETRWQPYERTDECQCHDPRRAVGSGACPMFAAARPPGGEHRENDLLRSTSTLCEQSGCCREARLHRRQVRQQSRQRGTVLVQQRLSELDIGNRQRNAFRGARLT